MRHWESWYSQFWPRGTWATRSQTRDWTCTPCIRRRNLNCWMAREDPGASDSFWWIAYVKQNGGFSKGMGWRFDRVTGSEIVRKQILREKAGSMWAARNVTAPGTGASSTSIKMINRPPWSSEIRVTSSVSNHPHLQKNRSATWHCSAFPADQWSRPLYITWGSWDFSLQVEFL